MINVSLITNKVKETLIPLVRDIRYFPTPTILCLRFVGELMVVWTVSGPFQRIGSGMLEVFFTMTTLCQSG